MYYVCVCVCVCVCICVSECVGICSFAFCCTFGCKYFIYMSFMSVFLYECVCSFGYLFVCVRLGMCLCV